MPNREKVIKGLEICYSPPSKCEDCPYHDLPDEQSCNDVLCLDALALLKELEPMTVRLTTSTIRCPKCGKQITSRGAIHSEIKFCWKCGQAVKW